MTIFIFVADKLNVRWVKNFVYKFKRLTVLEILYHLGRIGCDDNPAKGGNCVRDVAEVVVEVTGSLQTPQI